MNGSAAQVILSTIAVILGGGTVQLIIAIIRKRSELGNIDAQSDDIQAKIAERLRDSLAKESERQETRSLALEARIDVLHEESLRERAECDRRILAEVEASSRLVREVAKLRTDLAVARRQIRVLEHRLDTGDTNGEGIRP